MIYSISKLRKAGAISLGLGFSLVVLFYEPQETNYEWLIALLLVCFSFFTIFLFAKVEKDFVILGKYAHGLFLILWMSPWLIGKVLQLSILWNLMYCMATAMLGAVILVFIGFHNRRKSV